MFGKLLLTLAVILGAYLVIRTRIQRGRAVAAASPPPAREPLIPAAALRAVAYGLVVAMVAGSLLWLYLDWEAGASVVTVQVINANTGDVTLYQARRGSERPRSPISWPMRWRSGCARPRVRCLRSRETWRPC